MERVTVISAFIGGVLAFISPCILPILPGYLSFITGISLEELETHKKSKEVLLQTFKQSALFVLGFTIVFTALGTTAAATRSLPAWLISVFERAAGAVVIIFGLQLMGVINIPFLNYEKRIEAGKKRGFIGTVLLGMAFAFGWTPCVGPILASIYSLAAVNQPTVLEGVFYLLVFSLGIGIPFIASAVFLSWFIPLFTWLKRHMRVVMIVSGTLLLIMGVLMVSGLFGRLSLA